MAVDGPDPVPWPLGQENVLLAKWLLRRTWTLGDSGFQTHLCHTYTHLGEKAVRGAVVLCQDDGRHWVAVLKLGIVGKLRLEELDLLLVDVAGLDGHEEAGLPAVVHLPGRGRLDQG